MRDGVRLALNLYFPGRTEPAAPAPVILIQTRYGRALESRRGGAPRDIDYFLQRGFVVAIVDTRGSTSSFGAREVEMGPAERADMDEIIAHLAAQPWSDGRVIAYGVSYMADTAAFAATRPSPALVASIPRELDFDAYLHGFMPGGVQNDYLLYVWGNHTKTIDSGLSPSDETLDCVARAQDCAALFPLLQPVDEDRDFALLRQALEGRRHWGPEDYVNAPFRDDRGANGYSLFDFSPAAELAAWRREAKPMMVWGSWMDGPSAEAALALYRSAPELPLEIWITANNHGHNLNADPFEPARTTPAPSRDDQMNAVLGFIDRVLTGESIERRIHYYVMGAGTFRDTREWPPGDVTQRTFFLAPEARLAAQPPRPGEVRYGVDFEAGTGPNTRWSTQFGPPPAYPDRRDADQRLLVFDTEPMDDDMELVGHAVIDLWLQVSGDDAAVFAYLEDVAPDGRVSYITEGQLRAIHRAPADPAALPYDQGPAPHSFARADATPVRAGEMMNLRFALNPAAALVREGHRLRLAIAGADANVFRRYPAEGQLEFTLSLGRERSRVDLPLRPWNER
jgi:putative CocE/NonD family hydrolase